MPIATSHAHWHLCSQVLRLCSDTSGCQDRFVDLPLLRATNQAQLGPEMINLGPALKMDTLSNLAEHMTFLGRVTCRLLVI